MRPVDVAGPARSGGRWKRRYAILWLLSGGFAAGVLLAEGAVRLYAAFDSRFAKMMGALDPLVVKIVPSGDFSYRQRPYALFDYPNGTVATANTLGYRGPVVAIPKPPGTFRIVLLGESTTHGYGVNDDQTIDAAMRRLLAAEYPALAIEVVNLAFDGYDSYALWERLRIDGLRFEPDLVIVNAGINDVRDSQFNDLQDHDARTLLYSGVLRALRATARNGHPPLWVRVKHLSYIARLPGLVRTAIATKRDNLYRLRHQPHLAAVEYFGRNLQRIANLLADRHVPIVFSTPPSSLTTKYASADTSSRTYWIVDAGTTQRYRERLARRMAELAAELRRDGRPVTYVHPDLPPSLFLDDCHLTPEGNARVAEVLVAAIKPYIREWERGSHGRRLSPRDHTWTVQGENPAAHDAAHRLRGARL